MVNSIIHWSKSTIWDAIVYCPDEHLWVECRKVIANLAFVLYNIFFVKVVFVFALICFVVFVFVSNPRKFNGRSKMYSKIVFGIGPASFLSSIFIGILEVWKIVVSLWHYCSDVTFDQKCLKLWSIISQTNNDFSATIFSHDIPIQISQSIVFFGLWP